MAGDGTGRTGRKRVGILALQGDFEAHGIALRSAGAEPVPIRDAAGLQSIDGLVLPGGESTTMLNLLHRQELWNPLREFGLQKSIFGTCAGLILLASDVIHPQQDSLGFMDIAVERNGYGRQTDSVIASIDTPGGSPAESTGKPLEGVFIRAPIIRRAGPEVRVWGTYRGDPVLVQQGRHIGATFHPELTADTRIHQLFLKQL